MTSGTTGARTITTLAGGFVFGEGPRWHDGSLWISDMHGEAIYRTELDGTVAKVLALPGSKPSGLGFLPNGDLLFVLMGERQVMRFNGSDTTLHADVSMLVNDELNDMVVDDQGRAYVGTLALAPGEGVIVRIDLDGQAQVVATDLDCPNGTVISDDRSTLIVAESKGRRYTEFDIDDDGGLRNRRVFAEYGAGAGDGIALDAEGAIWAAVPLAHRFIRILPGGRITDELDFGDRMPVACVLGGADRRTLFLLSATDVYGEHLVGVRESRIDFIVVDVPGAGIP